MKNITELKDHIKLDFREINDFSIIIVIGELPYLDEVLESYGINKIKSKKIRRDFISNEFHGRFMSVSSHDYLIWINPDLMKPFRMVLDHELEHLNTELREYWKVHEGSDEMFVRFWVNFIWNDSFRSWMLNVESKCKVCNKRDDKADNLNIEDV